MCCSPCIFFLIDLLFRHFILVVSELYMTYPCMLTSLLSDDHHRTVRSCAALALGKLSALSTRVDPLVGDLLSSLQVMSLFVSPHFLSLTFA